MTTKKYFATDKFGDRNFIKVEISYQKGGMNVWTGNVDGRGLWMYIIPVEKRGLMEGFHITGQSRDGIRFPIKALGRKNDKAHASIWEKMESKLEEIARLFESEQYSSAVDLAMTLAR